MKCEISTGQFKNALKAMEKLKDKELSIATDILIQSKDSNIQLVRSNNETTIIQTIKDSIYEPGTIILPIQTAETIKKLKENYFTITDNKITTTKKTISFNQPEMIKINTYDNIPFVFLATQRELLRMLEVMYAVAHDKIRPILTGVCFKNNETCALDGYRLSFRKSNEYNINEQFVVNQFSLEILLSVLKPVDDIVNVYYNDNIVKFEINNITIIGKCLQGEFIKYKQIIPEDYRNKSIVNPIELLEEIDFIKVADGRNFLKTDFTIDDKIILKGNQCKQQYSEKLSEKDFKKRQEEADEKYKEKYKKWIAKGKKGKEPIKTEVKFKKIYELVPISDITSEISVLNELSNNDVERDNFQIAYNPNYMIDALKQYNDKVELQMTSRVAPIVVTNDRDRGLELVLPIRMVS